jgi:hypothetical protein
VANLIVVVNDAGSAIGLVRQPVSTLRRIFFTVAEIGRASDAPEAFNPLPGEDSLIRLRSQGGVPGVDVTRIEHEIITRDIGDTVSFANVSSVNLSNVQVLVGSNELSARLMGPPAVDQPPAVQTSIIVRYVDP